MSTRETIRNKILRTLIDGPMGFENIVKTTRLSRGCVNNYLNAFLNEPHPLVAQEKGHGARKYFLTTRGKEQAGKLFVVEIAAAIPNAKTVKQLRLAFTQMENIIKKANETPDEDLPALFSCVWDINAKSGVLKFDQK